MMKKLFDNAVDNIINSKKINNISLKNIEIIKYVLKDKIVSKKLYKMFKKNYEVVYGSDLDWLLMKVEDMVYRCNLLINSVIIDKFGVTDKNAIRDAINCYLDSNNENLFDSVDYNDNDLEIINNYQDDIVGYLVQL